jgi:hypothetical protein
VFDLISDIEDGFNAVSSTVVLITVNIANWHPPVENENRVYLKEDFEAHYRSDLGQMRLCDELSGCLHSQRQMRALMVIVIEKSLGALLGEGEVSGLTGDVTKPSVPLNHSIKDCSFFL